MALAITDFEPKFGLTAGGTMIVITGTDFAELTPTEAAPNEPLPAPAPSVRVRFGPLEVTKILAQSSTRLILVSPAVDVDTMLGIGELDPNTNLPSAELDLAITVENIDELGGVLETAVSAETYAYRLQQTSDPTVLSTLTSRVLNSLRAWLHPRIYHKPHPDYAMAEFSSGGAEVFIFNRADAPAYAVLGPDLAEDKFAQPHALNSEPALGDAAREREPYYAVLTYQLLGFATTSTELLAMQDQMLRIFRDWKAIPHPSGEGTIDVDLMSFPRAGDTPNNGGLQSFTSTFRLNHVPIGLASARFANDLLIEWATQIDEPMISISQVSPPTELAPSPGPTPSADPGDLQPALRFPKFDRPPTVLFEKKSP